MSELLDSPILSRMKRRMRLSPFVFDPKRPVDSITKQTQWNVGFFDFPMRPQVRYFNPAIVRCWGQRFLITRRLPNFPRRNDLTMWALDANLRPVSERQILFFKDNDRKTNREDPRAFVVNGTLIVSYAVFQLPWERYPVHQSFATINERYQANNVIDIAYAKNGAVHTKNTGPEKNWVWFHDGLHLNCVYSPEPHVVFQLNGNTVAREWETRGIEWRYGTARGGTSPVLHQGLYWCFFHSMLTISERAPRRRYFMGAYAFSANPPYTVRQWTRKPLLIGSEEDPFGPDAPCCVFPCGAILENDEWIVSFGVNDCRSAWIRIPHFDLVRRMTSASYDATRD